jgi:hypothetical protein
MIMRTYCGKLLLIAAFVAVSAVCQSQVFSAHEFVNLTFKDQDALRNAIEAKGYYFAATEHSDLSVNDIYTGRNNMNVSIIKPTFEDGQTLISWEFTGADQIYRSLKEQLRADGYRVLENEVRNRARYIVTTYQKPGVTVTLSCDKLSSPYGIYRLSARYSTAAWMGR